MATLAAAFGMALLFGCSKGSTPADGDKAAGPAKRTLVMIPKATQSSFWNAVQDGAMQAAKELDVTVTWKGPMRENDRAAQKQVVQQFTTDGVDGILLAPTDSKILVAEARTAMLRKIPVLIFDSGLDGESGKDFISFVATDNSAAGRMGGKHLMELVGKGGKTVLLRHLEGHDSTTKREEGALAEMNAGGANVLSSNRYSGESSGDAQTTVLNMIDVIREAGGVFASNQTASEGLLLALRQNNLAGKVKVVGFDSSPLLVEGVRNGEIDALVVQDPVKMGYTSVKLMVDHLDGKPIEELVNTEAHLVTRENMDDPKIAPLLK